MTVLLLDGHNLLFRSFTTLPRSITAKTGEPINGVYGLLGTVMRLGREYEADHVIAAFDVPEVPTFRHLRYPGYQAQRGPLGGEHADEFRWQTEIARKALPEIGVPALTAPGFEADDVLGTLSRQIKGSPPSILISTDRDLMQLVAPGVEILIPGTNALRVRDANDVEQIFGVPPNGVTTFKALAGDASDNIPGVPGIGKKTAIALVQEYGTLESIEQNLDRLPARTATAFRAHRDDAYLFRDLATIDTGLELEIDLHALPATPFPEATRPRDVLESLGHGRP